MKRLTGGLACLLLAGCSLGTSAPGPVPSEPASVSAQLAQWRDNYVQQVAYLPTRTGSIYSVTSTSGEPSLTDAARAQIVGGTDATKETLRLLAEQKYDNRRGLYGDVPDQAQTTYLVIRALGVEYVRHSHPQITESLMRSLRGESARPQMDGAQITQAVFGTLALRAVDPGAAQGISMSCDSLKSHENPAAIIQAATLAAALRLRCASLAGSAIEYANKAISDTSGDIGGEAASLLAHAADLYSALDAPPPDSPVCRAVLAEKPSEGWRLPRPSFLYLGCFDLQNAAGTAELSDWVRGLNQLSVATGGALVDVQGTNAMGYRYAAQILRLLGRPESDVQHLQRPNEGTADLVAAVQQRQAGGDFRLTPAETTALVAQPDGQPVLDMAILATGTCPRATSAAPVIAQPPGDTDELLRSALATGAKERCPRNRKLSAPAFTRDEVRAFLDLADDSPRTLQRAWKTDEVSCLMTGHPALDDHELLALLQKHAETHRRVSLDLVDVYASLRLLKIHLKSCRGALWDPAGWAE